MSGIAGSDYQERSVIAPRDEAFPSRDTLRIGAHSRDGHETTRGFSPQGFRLSALLQRDLAIVRTACVFEWVALTYLGTSSALIAVFAENTLQKLRLLGTQALVAMLILALCRKEARLFERENFRSAAEESDTRLGSDALSRATFTQRFWHFWRHWYPHLFFLFCFEEMSRLVHLVQPEWQDAKLIAFDQWLTGVNPSLWLERFAHPPLTEFMEFAYFTYFLFLLILGAVLYYRREWKSYWAVMTYSAVGYTLGYVIATLFPVQSPWFMLAGMWHADLVGGPFTALINFIEKCGRVRGAAFPSQHVAGATAALWGAWEHRRWLFWAFLPFVICMCASTVYVRNHYVADVLGGLVTGTLGYVIGDWLIKRRAESEAVRKLGCQDGTAGLRKGAFEQESELEQQVFVGHSADELDTNGQAIRSKARGDGNSGHASEIGWTVIAKKQGPSGMVR
jgi:membrane-associated phospholipid phosphatase